VLAFLLNDSKLNKELVNARGMTGMNSTAQKCMLIGFVALHQAAWYGQNEAIQMLLRAGVSIDRTTPEGHSAIDIAKMMGHGSTFKILEVAMQEAAKAQVETPEQLRQRLKQQHNTNTQRRIVQLQKSLASMTETLSSKRIETTNDKSVTPLQECNDVKQNSHDPKVGRPLESDLHVVSNKRAGSAKEKLQAYESEDPSFFLTQEDKSWRPLSSRPR